MKDTSSGQNGNTGNCGGGSGGIGGGIYGNEDLADVMVFGGGGGGGGGWRRCHIEKVDRIGGADGGGIIMIWAGKIDTSSGYLSAKGNDGGAAAGDDDQERIGAGGSGAGGSVYLIGVTVDIGTNRVDTRGGTGHEEDSACHGGKGGDGGIGRIRIEYCESISGTTDLPTSTEKLDCNISLPISIVNLSKSLTPTVATPGQRITYTLAYSNTGLDLAAGVMITDAMPLVLTDVSYVSNGAQITPTGDISFTWRVQDLAPDQGGVITITATINPDLDAITSIVNQATVNDGRGQIFTTPPVTTIVTPEPAPWTLIVYLNGDNSLDPITDDIFHYLERGACNSNVNIVALWDRSPGHPWDLGTRRYKVRCNTNPFELADYVEGKDTWNNGEMNLGDGQTLYDFVSWTLAEYPADHYWLSIIDHGGGWSPELPIGMPRTGGWHLGGAGLSWDETGAIGDPDYLSTHEMGEVLRYLSDEGADPLDLVFYDAHLMAMLEEAYEIEDYVRYFVASENTAWGTFRYDHYVAPITADTQPAELAEHIVATYGAALLNQSGTMSAMDLSATGDVAAAVDDLAQALMAGQSNAAIREQIGEAYIATQKLDYDGDGEIEQDREGYVDLYDLVEQIELSVDSAAITAAAQEVMNVLDASGFVLAEEHRSRQQELDDVHGVSIYLPFGEELYIGSGCDDSVLDLCVVNADPACIKLRDYYTTTTPPQTQQLSFAQDTAWDEFANSFIAVYYCDASVAVSALHLRRVEAQALPPIRPVAILNEPRKPLFDINEWIRRPVGGITFGFGRERGLYLPILLRDH